MPSDSDADGPEHALDVIRVSTTKLVQPPAAPPPSVPMYDSRAAPKPLCISCVCLDDVSSRLYFGFDSGELQFVNLGTYGSGKQHPVGSHAGQITTVCAPSRDAGPLRILNAVLSGSSDATIKLWDYKGRVAQSPAVCIQTLYGHEGTVMCLASLGNLIISGSTDRTVRLWRADPGRPEQLTYPWYLAVQTLTVMDGWVRCMCMGRSRQDVHAAVVHVADDTGAIVRLVAQKSAAPPTGRQGAEYDIALAPRAAATSPALSPSPALSTAAAATTWELSHLHDQGITAIHHVPEQQLLLTLCYDNCLRVLDLLLGVQRHRWENENGCLFTGMVYDAACGQVLTTDQLGYLAIYSLRSDSLLATKRLAAQAPLWIAPCLQRDTYCVVFPAQYQLWQVDRDLDHNTVRGGHTKAVIALYVCGGQAAAPGAELDSRVFSASLDSTVRLWDPYDMACIRVMQDTHSEISAMTFCEAHNLAATGHDNGDVRLWNCDTGSSVRLQHHTNSVTGLCWAQLRKSEGLLLSVSFEGLLCLWDVRSSKGDQPHLVASFQAHGLDPATRISARRGLARVVQSPALCKTPGPAPPRPHSLLGLQAGGGSCCNIPTATGERPLAPEPSVTSKRAAVGRSSSITPSSSPAPPAPPVPSTSHSPAPPLPGDSTSTVRVNSESPELVLRHRRTGDAAPSASPLPLPDPAWGLRRTKSRTPQPLITPPRSAIALTNYNSSTVTPESCSLGAESPMALSSNTAPASLTASTVAVAPGVSSATLTRPLPPHHQQQQQPGASISDLTIQMSHEPEILCVAFDPLKKAILTAGNDRSIKAWGAYNYSYLGQHQGHREAVTCIALDGNFLFSGSEDQSIRVWDAVPVAAAGTQRMMIAQETGLHQPFISSPLKVLNGHSSTVTALCVLPLSGQLVSCSTEGLLLFWDYVAGTVLRRHQHHEEMACLAYRWDANEVLVGTRQNHILRYSANEADHDVPPATQDSESGTNGGSSTTAVTPDPVNMMQYSMQALSTL